MDESEHLLMELVDSLRKLGVDEDTARRAVSTGNIAWVLYGEWDGFSYGDIEGEGDAMSVL